MRNLKKVMALAIVFAMALTMMAGAAFTDEDSIVNKDAVNTVAALGIIAGYPDGSFQGEKTVTRAEMAKMIYVLRTGKESADIYKGSSVALSDVDGHWAEGFIKYCYTLGIVAGKGAGKFDPDAPVTGLEAAKMLLTVAGYKADKSGLVGAQWGVNTARIAAEANLWDNYDVPFANNAPRDYAALLIFNTLDTELVKWSNDAEDYEWVYKGTEYKITVGEQFLGLLKDEGTLVTSGKVSLLMGRGASERLDIVDEEDELVRFSKVEDDYTDLLGQNVKVLYKVENSKKVVYGVFATQPEDAEEYVVETTLGEVELDLDEDDKVETITVGDVEIDWVLGESKAVIVGDIAVDDEILADPANYAELMASHVKVVYNEDDEAIYAIITPVILDKVTFANKDQFGLKYEGVTVDLEDDDTFGDVVVNGTLKKNAWVLLSPVTFDGNMVVDVIEKTEGKVDATRNSGEDVRVDGTWYTVADDDAEISRGKTYEYFVFGQYLVEVEPVEDDEVNIDEVLLVTQVADEAEEFNEDVIKAKVLFVDGTSKVVEVDISDDDYVVEPKEDTLYTFELDGDYYLLSEIDEEDFEAVVDDDYADNKFGSYKVDSGAVVFVKYQSSDKDKYAVYTGAEANDFSDSLEMDNCVAYVDEVNKLNRVVLAYAESGAKPAEDGEILYAYVPGNANDYTDEDDITYFTIWNGTENVEVWVDDDAFDVSKFEGKLIAYEDLGDGEIDKNVEEVGEVVAIETVVDGTVVFYGDATEYALVDDTTYFYIDGDDEVGVKDGELDSAVAAGENAYYNNAIVVFGDGNDFEEDEVEVILYVTDMKFADKSTWEK